MKIVVMWEDPSEEEAARSLTDMMPNIATVAMRYVDKSKRPRVRARCCPADKEFLDAVRETSSPCLVCGVMKYDGAQCRNCRERDDALETLRAKLSGDPIRPPKETRELIFPEDD